ncbi:isopentenyl-diphosphate Delta-isomerase [Candidatus Peregrinibacteria bacterium]|nr:isopentenyl-diphosphate Delta-isomerase [Candidatus Peregrinibacteria bacterium]
MRTVILVDEDNNEIGTSEIVEAHTGEGKLHRAFSVYVFRNKGKEILIQKRSAKKMLWPEIWANTCCSHPQNGESARQAGERRLKEELGFTCPLKALSGFVYRAEDPEKRGVEHEFVTILLGLVDETVTPSADPDEVAEWKWIGVEELRGNMRREPAKYAPWFHLGMNAIRESIPS